MRMLLGPYHSVLLFFDGHLLHHLLCCCMRFWWSCAKFFVLKDLEKLTAASVRVLVRRWGA